MLHIIIQCSGLSVISWDMFQRLFKDERRETYLNKEETYLELAPYHFQYFINLVSVFGKQFSILSFALTSNS